MFGGHIIYFSDIKTGLNFKGKLLDEKIQLSIYLENQLVTQIGLNRSQNDWQIGEFTTNEKHKNSRHIELTELENLIVKDSLPNTHSILIFITSIINSIPFIFRANCKFSIINYLKNIKKMRLI